MKATAEITPVIMAGGAGTRFWPLSTEELPKQFLTAFSEESLYQQTVARAAMLALPGRTLVMTNHRLLKPVRTQSPQIPPGNVVLEPLRRDTAAAVTLAAVIAEKRWPGSVMVVLPSDHIVKDWQGFCNTIRVAAERAQMGGLGTIGVRPTYPAVCYGYLHTTEASPSPDSATQVEAFVEKPDRARAEAFCESGNYLWNAGIFVWKATTLLAEVEKHLPGIYKHLAPLADAVDSDSFAPMLDRAFKQVPAISIDFGVMEKAADVWTVPAAFEWSDVGGWRSAAELVEPDARGNRVSGRAVVEQSRNSLVISGADSRPVLVAGVEGLIVVTTDTGTLVCSQEMAEELKPLVQRILRGDRGDE